MTGVLRLILAAMLLVLATGTVRAEQPAMSALADYALDWNGMIEINITPLMDDETIGKVLGEKFS